MAGEFGLLYGWLRNEEFGGDWSCNVSVEFGVIGSEIGEVNKN